MRARRIKAEKPYRYARERAAQCCSAPLQALPFRWQSFRKSALLPDAGYPLSAAALPRVPDRRCPARAPKPQRGVKERRFAAELIAMPDSAADNPAQHITAAFVTGYYTVCNQKSTGADMVGNHL